MNVDISRPTRTITIPFPVNVYEPLVLVYSSDNRPWLIESMVMTNHSVEIDFGQDFTGRVVLLSKNEIDKINLRNTAESIERERDAAKRH